MRSDIIYQVVSGSHAYGIATPESDTDYRGVFKQTIRDHFDLRGYYREHWEDPGHDDAMYWELKHFLKLCLSGNPNTLETLFIDDPELILTQHESIGALKTLRDSFLSQRLKRTYVGYAVSQFKDYLAYKFNQEPNAQYRKIKSLAHAYRLCVTYKNLCDTGKLLVKLPDNDLRVINVIRNANPFVLPEVEDLIKRYLDKDFVWGDSRLSLTPETDLINEWYLDYMGVKAC